MDRRSSVRELAVTADRVVDTVIVIGQKFHLAILHCVQFIVFVEAVFLHIGTKEGHFSFEDARVIDAHVLLLHKGLELTSGDRVLL